MGWWDPGIFGGDAPLDAVAELQKLLGLPAVWMGEARFNLYPVGDWDDVFREKVKEVLREHEAEVIKWVEEEESDSYKYISAQVLGAVFMATGGPMPDRIRELVVTLACKDEWAIDEPESRRHGIITEFIGAVRGYEPGTSVVMTSKGLFEKIGEQLDGRGESEASAQP